MGKRLPVFLAAFCMLWVSGPGFSQDSVDDDSATRFGGIPGEKWVAEDRYGEFTVVVADNAPELEHEAARMFRDRWNRITGEDIPIQSTIGDGINVLIGARSVPRPMLQELGFIRLPMEPDRPVDLERQLSNSGVGHNGFRVATLGTALIIVGGTPRGTMNGVDWFFDAVMGYTPGAGSYPPAPEAIERLDTLIVPQSTAWLFALYIALGLFALFIVHWAVNRYYDEEVPLGLSLPLCILAIASCVIFFVWFLELLTAVWGPFAQPLAPILTFGVCFWPVRGYAMTVIQSFGKRGVQFMYGFEEAHGFESEEYGPPRVYKVTENVSDRIKEYRAFFSDDPSNPRPLFEAAQLFEHHEYFEEAAEAYREIIQLFHRDESIWAEANFRLAALHEESLFNRQGALEILRRIAERAPNTDYGKLASARLAENSGKSSSGLPPLSSGSSHAIENPESTPEASGGGS